MKSLRPLVPLMFFLLVASTSHGATSPSVAPDRSDLRLGAFALSDVNVRFRLSSPSNPAGTDLDFARDLGGERSISVFRADATWNLVGRHSLDAAWYDVDLRGLRALSFNVQFGDRNYTVGTTVSSRMRANVYKLSYGYAFLQRGRHEIRGLLGVHVMRLETDLATSGGAIAERYEITAPLPSLGLEWKANWTDRLSTRVSAQYFGLATENDSSGHFIDALAALEYRFTEHTGLGGGFNRFKLSADFRSNGRVFAADYSYNGVLAYGFVRF